jgi:hypothetical protein
LRPRDAVRSRTQSPSCPNTAAWLRGRSPGPADAMPTRAPNAAPRRSAGRGPRPCAGPHLAGAWWQGRRKPACAARREDDSSEDDSRVSARHSPDAVKVPQPGPSAAACGGPEAIRALVGLQEQAAQPAWGCMRALAAAVRTAQPPRAARAPCACGTALAAACRAPAWQPLPRAGLSVNPRPARPLRTPPCPSAW